MASSDKKLSPKQLLFIKEYLIDLNATQAAIRAGYSAKTAQEQSSRLLSNVMVKELLQVEMDKRAEKAGITAERVLNEIAKMAFLDPRKLFDSDGKPLHITALDDDTAASIAGLDVVTTGNQDVGFAEVLKIKLADKAKNLELLGRHLKLFTDKQEVSVPNGINMNVTSETPSQLAKLKEKKLKAKSGNATVSTKAK